MQECENFTTTRRDANNYSHKIGTATGFNENTVIVTIGGAVGAADASMHYGRDEARRLAEAILSAVAWSEDRDPNFHPASDDDPASDDVIATAPGMFIASGEVTP